MGPRNVLPGVIVTFLAVLVLVLSEGNSTDEGLGTKRYFQQNRKVTAKPSNLSQFGPASNNLPAAVGAAESVWNSSVSSSSTSTHSKAPPSSGKAAAKKQRLIHGSKNAVTITKKEYLKKDWCKTEPFQQVVDEDGCVKKRIMNRFCYGQCNSFFIPKTDKEDQDGSSFRSCAYCTPHDAEWVTVVLRCPTRIPPFKRKRVQIIKQCKCMAVKLD